MTVASVTIAGSSMSALLWTIRSSSWGGLGLRPGPANSERQRERRGGLRGGRVEMQKSIKISNYFKYKSQLSSSELHDSSNKQDLLNVFTGCWRRWATALNFNILNSGRYRIHRCVKVVKCFLSTVKRKHKTLNVCKRSSEKCLHPFLSCGWWRLTCEGPAW